MGGVETRQEREVVFEAVAMEHRGGSSSNAGRSDTEVSSNIARSYGVMLDLS